MLLSIYLVIPEVVFHLFLYDHLTLQYSAIETCDLHYDELVLLTYYLTYIYIPSYIITF